MRATALALLLSFALAGCGDDDEENAVTCDPSPPADAPAEVNGCGGQLRLEQSADTALPGAWPVGARTVRAGELTLEVWYPAALGSEVCGAPKRYDLRAWLPDSEQGKIPDADTLIQTCDCRDGLPLDVDHGPYPVIVFVHGTAGFRTQSLAQMTHWASRGFVVVAADHPGLYLADALKLVLKRDLDGDVSRIFEALGAPSGGLGFLSAHLDLDHSGMAGHSAGGAAIAAAGERAGVRVVSPWAAGGTQAGANLESTLVLGGLADQVVPYDKTVEGYLASPAKKRLLGIANAGHLFPTELCWLTNDSGENMLQVAQKYDVENASLAQVLFDCPADQPSRERARDIVNAATSAAFEETLACAPGDAFQGLPARYPEIADFREAL